MYSYMYTYMYIHNHTNYLISININGTELGEGSANGTLSACFGTM